MSSANPVQIPRNLLFHYRFDLRQAPSAATTPLELPTAYRLGSFGRFEGQLNFAEWRGAWSNAGLYFQSIVKEKKVSLWCRPNQLLESDSFRVWIDTRNTRNVARATRYCHWVVALPAGGTGKNPAFCSMLRINRAREDSPALNRAKITCESELASDGYNLRLFIPAATLNGWDPADHPHLGLCLASLDREFGWQTLTAGADLPIDENPSLWSTFRLAPAT